jgi:hypothetical protein
MPLAALRRDHPKERLTTGQLAEFVAARADLARDTKRQISTPGDQDGGA